MFRLQRWAALFIVLLFPITLFAANPNQPVVSGSSVQWSAAPEFDHIQLVIQTPTGTTYSKDFASGQGPQFTLKDFNAEDAIDGTYSYELRYVPRVSNAVKKSLADARARNDEASINRVMRANGLNKLINDSGVLTVSNGTFITPSNDEPTNKRRNSTSSSSSVMRTGSDALKASPNDVVTADDEIIQGSLCVGLDCVNNESFGFDTIRLKENNTRIKFDDTSSSTGFPNTDWQITANDSASGGANKFSVEDITDSKVPFTVTGNAPTNSLFVASSGKIGFGNSSPGLNLHITATDTPAIRQEQTSGGGFTAQTWDIGANEANWFVRDLTGGSRLPFRIRPGAPTSSIDIAASGNVGIGTASPAARLHVDATGTNNPGGGTSSIWVKSENNKDAIIGLGAGPNFADNADGLVIAYNGNAGVGRAFIGTRPSSGTGTITFAVKNATQMQVTSTGIDVTTAIRVGGTTLNVPDYVFEPDYQLMSLDSLKQFVETEKHLPNIPSQRDIKANGVDIAGFNMNLLQKVEELTLYTVAQNEMIKKLEARLSQLEKELNKQ